MSSKISINNVQSIISQNNHLDYENLKSIFEESGVDVREVKIQQVSNENGENELSDLYLLVSKENEHPTPLQIECNGLILEKETNKVVCMCLNKFNKISNINAINQMEIIENLKIQHPKVRMEYCEDGTVIRLYNRVTGWDTNHRNNWYTATTKCIDARKSYWSSEKTFDDMFWEIFDKSGYNVSDLNINCTYSFILLHRENRIVVNHRYNNLIYINSVHNGTQEESFTNYFFNQDPKRCIRRTKQIDINSGIHYPLDDYYLPDKRGVILKFFDETNNKWSLWQYDFQQYGSVKEIRGNVPLIRMRYLELLNEPEKLAILEKEYPENQMLFAMIKHCMNNLYKRVHKLYFESHVKHNITVTDTDPLFKTLRQLHGAYKKQGTIVTFEVVIQKVNSLDKNIIKSLLNWV
jgi:hypothetical protein